MSRLPRRTPHGQLGTVPGLISKEASVRAIRLQSSQSQMRPHQDAIGEVLGHAQGSGDVRFGSIP